MRSRQQRGGAALPLQPRALECTEARVPQAAARDDSACWVGVKLQLCSSPGRTAPTSLAGRPLEPFPPPTRTLSQGSHACCCRSRAASCTMLLHHISQINTNHLCRPFFPGPHATCAPLASPAGCCRRRYCRRRQPPPPAAAAWPGAQPASSALRPLWALLIHGATHIQPAAGALHSQERSHRLLRPLHPLVDQAGRLGQVLKAAGGGGGALTSSCSDRTPQGQQGGTITCAFVTRDSRVAVPASRTACHVARPAGPACGAPHQLSQVGQAAEDAHI